MNMQQLKDEFFDEPHFCETTVKGVAYTEMKNSLSEISKVCEDLNNLGIEDFKFTGLKITDPIREVQRSIFNTYTRGSTKAARNLKLDRNSTFMIDLNFEFRGQPLNVCNIRVPCLSPGSKFELNGKNQFVGSVLVDRGINVANGGLFIPLSKIRFTMTRSTQQFIMNHCMISENVLIGNPHNGKKNKVGRGDERIGATQNIVLYLLAKHGLTKTIEMVGATGLEFIEGESYEEVFNEYYPKGYTVFGPTGIKPGKAAFGTKWEAPEIFAIYKGDLKFTTDEYQRIGLMVANFYYVVDRVSTLITFDVLDDTEFWLNILGRFIFYAPNKPGSWYTEEGRNHIVNSVDNMIDFKTQRRLAMDDIKVSDMYELIAWLGAHEKELYANVHPSDISRKRVTAISYLLSYITTQINVVGYKLLTRVKENGKLDPNMTLANMNRLVGGFLNERLIRELTKKDHGEVRSIESCSANMLVTNTRVLIDQTKVKQKKKTGANHMHDPNNFQSATKIGRIRIDGIDKALSSDHISPLLQLGPDKALDIPKWMQPIEAKLAGDLKEVF